jgi:hypothetical protein
MSSVQEFTCQDCAQFWRDKYSFWNGYRSACPRCGKACDAVCDTQVHSDQQEMAGFYDGPLFDFESEDYEKTEADLDAERDVIHDEIAEAIGAVGSETSGADEDSDGDEDAEGDADGGGDGL